MTKYKRLNIPPDVEKNRKSLEKLRKEKRYWWLHVKRTDQYFNIEHYEPELMVKYGERKRLFEQFPQMKRDFAAGLALRETYGSFLLESAAYRIRLLLVYKDDGHYDFPLATLFSNGIIDNLVECCRYGHWHGVRSRAAETLGQVISDGTTAQVQELVNRDAIPVLLQMLNDEEIRHYDDEKWLDYFVTNKAVNTLASLSAKLDVGGDLVTRFVNQDLCGRLMLLFKHPKPCIVDCVLTFVENFLTRGGEDQIQVLHEHQVLDHLAQVLADPAWHNLSILIVQYKAAEALGNFARRSTRWRDLVIDTAPLIPLFQLLHRLSREATSINTSSAIRASRTIGNLCFGSPPPSFDKLRPSLPVLRYLIDLELRIEEEAIPVLKHACLIIACLARGGFDPINALIEQNMCPRLVMLLAHTNSEVVANVLKIVENFFRSGTDNQIQVLHGNQVLQRLLNILNNHDNRPLTLRSVCRAIANIVSYRSSQIQRMVDAAIFPPIIQIAINQEVDDIKYEAVYAISSAARRGSQDQIRYLVGQGSIEALSLGLLCEGYTRRTSCFQGLLNILRVGEVDKVDGVNPYAEMVTNSGGLARIQSQMDDPDVGEIARKMLRLCWPREL
ncbi:importin subunit alpha-8-like [Nicotiana tabacum]|uniref:Importin subunit alpha-8-like n=1 Tax=Nicotiana tabacum TaxID=4097 RepID=A0AC58T4D7_TOBAC